jgi:ABC-2 type transport system ATP-binding protein
MTMTLEAKNLEVRYGRLRALDQVSLAVKEGSVYALLGRNGAGKSSFIRCLLGHQKPQGGSVALFGQDAWRGRTQAMARIGVVPEEPDAPPFLTAQQVADFCSRLHLRWDGQAVLARLNRFKVPLDTPVGRLSRGQKAQVSLALALGSQPDLLVLDDPTLGLDAVARKACFEELVEDLADRGTTVFITTHDLAGVEGIADRVGILQEGRLLLDEELESLKARFRRIQGSPNQREAALEEMAPLTFISSAYGTEATVSRFSEATFAKLQETGLVDGEACSISLEELFITLTAGKEVPA